MKGTLTQPDYHSVKVYYPPGDIWQAVYQMAYENNCVCNGCPKGGPGIGDNQGFQFPDGHSARAFLREVKSLPDVTAEIATGNLLEAKI